MTRRVALTGVTGFIGRHVAEQLRAAGWRVRGLVRPTSRRPPPAGVDVVRVEYTETALARACEGVEAVIHLAGIVQAAADGAFAAANVEATRHVAGAARAVGARLLYLSSQSVGGPGGTARPVRETDLPNPVTPYAVSKLQGEEAVRGTPDLAWTILRAVSVYGPGDRAFLPVFRLARLGVAPIVGDADAAYSLIHVSDLARAIEMATSHPAALGEVFFVGHPEPATTRRMVALIGEAVGRQPRLLRVPPSVAAALAHAGEGARRLGFLPTLDRARLTELTAGGFVCRVSKARDRLGFEAEVPLASGLERTAAWYRDAGLLR